MKHLRVTLNIVAIIILVFFITSFFLGLRANPNFTQEVAASPYGLFSYFIVTVMTAFIPSLATLPLVTTATIIWGPWLAGIVAIVGWTLGSMVEYYVALYAMGSLSSLVDIESSRAGRKIARVRDALKLWQVVLLRLFIPPFVFGVVKTNIRHYVIASVVAYLPLAAVGMIGGELLREQIEQARPLIVGAAFLLMIFALDFIFVEKTEKKIHGKENGEEA